MVAIAQSAPRQLSYLEASKIAPGDVIRLAWWIRRLCYGDALISGSFRLERQRFEHISDVEIDHANDGTLVMASYAEYLLFVAGRVTGVLEVRARGRKRVRHIEGLSTYLLEAGWILAGTQLIEGGALASPCMRVDRVRRLLKGG